MSEAKHTPGPWTFGHWGNDFWVGTEPSGLTGKVARVIWQMGERVEEGRENARLISAAPEMLEALKIADAVLSGAHMNMKIVEKKIKAAIAKAEDGA